MRADFQDEVMKFLLQSKEGKKYIPMLDKSCFDLPTNKIIFDLLEEYEKKYHTSPYKTNMLEYFDRTAKRSDVSKEVYKALEQQIVKLYEPLMGDVGLIRDSIREFSQRKRTKNLFKDNADKVKDGDEDFFKDMYRKMSEIVNIDKETDLEDNRGGFLLADHDSYKFELSQGHPTFLKALNKMTAAGGFFSPMLIAFMGAPKAFKTGVMLKIAVEYVRDGLKVYYADTENGIKSIRARADQAILECERKELHELADELEVLIKQFKNLGGDMNIGFYPAHTKTLDDVDAELEYLKDEFGWIPDLIVYDYLDLFKSSNNSIKDKRLQIQDIYHHAVRLNNKWGCFAMTVSTVNKNAVNKEVIKITDFGEDFGKAYNCHAAFAICRTADEMETGFARIIPVAQREGVPYRGGATTCTIKIDEARMFIEEVDMEEIVKKNKRRKDLTDD